MAISLKDQLFGVEHLTRALQLGRTVRDFAGLLVGAWFAVFGFQLRDVVDAVLPGHLAGGQAGAALGEVETNGGGFWVDQVAVVDAVAVQGADFGRQA